MQWPLSSAPPFVFFATGQLDTLRSVSELMTDAHQMLDRACFSRKPFARSNITTAIPFREERKEDAPAITRILKRGNGKTAGLCGRWLAAEPIPNTSGIGLD